MPTMYCALCGRPVEAKRQIGAGSVLLAIFTAGISLLAIPFYPKRCSICKSAAVSLSPPGTTTGGPGSLPHRLAELERRLAFVEEELEHAGVELGQLRAERDFYNQLLGDPTAREGERGADE